ncbi:MAG: RDD family protein [Carboxydocellales bacterium]
MYCAFCGKEMPEKSKFCPQCGNQSSPPAADKGHQQNCAAVQPAGVGLRFVAAIIDIVILIVIGYILAAGFGTTSSNGFELYGAAFFLNTLLQLAYFIGFEGIKGGTPGKMVVGLRIIKTDGSSCDIRAALIRTILRIADGFPYFIPYVLGMVLIFTSKQKQRLGDRVANTMVVTGERKIKFSQVSDYSSFNSFDD